MYIRRKVYSLLQDESGEERLFSTTDFELDQKEFARRDYEGLNEEGRKILKEERSKLAKQLAQKRRIINGVREADLETIKKGRRPYHDPTFPGNDPIKYSQDSRAKYLDEFKRKSRNLKLSLKDKYKAVEKDVANKEKVTKGLVSWAKKNPKLAAGSAIGAITAGGIGAYIYKKNKKK